MQDVKTHVHQAKEAVVTQVVKIHANLDVKQVAKQDAKQVVKLTAKRTVNQNQKQIEDQITLAP